MSAKSHPIREWPTPVRRKALNLYIQHYTMPYISKETGVGESTLRFWRTNLGWVEARERFKMSLEEELQGYMLQVAKSYNKTLQTWDKINDRIQLILDSGDIVPEELAALALAFERNSGVLLRLLGK